MRVLVIRLSSLGDVVLATPVARLLRTRYPEAHVDVVVAREYADVWRSNPHITRLIEVTREKGAWAMAHAVGGKLMPYYDVVVDLQCNLRSWAIRRKKAPEILRYAKHRIEKLALVWFKMRCVHIGHVAERYIQALAPLDVVDDGDGLELWLPDERGEAVYPPRMRSVPDTPALGIAPGARHATKQWIPDNFIALAQTFQKRGWQIILLGSAAERTLCASIARQLESSLTLDVSGSSLYDSVRAVDHCCVVVANDSAVVHLAAARRIPVVTIYGSTVPELGFTPFRVPHRVVEANVWCRPCSHIGRARCPLGHFACMRAITPHRVIAAVEELSRA